MHNDLDVAKQAFLIEVGELLTTMEDALLYLEDAPKNGEEIATVSRAVHAIKEGAAVFSFDYIVSFIKVTESLLDKISNEEVSLDKQMVALLLASSDHISELVDELIDNNNKINDELLSINTQLITQLNSFVNILPIETAQTPLVEKVEETLEGKQNIKETIIPAIKGIKKQPPTNLEELDVSAALSVDSNKLDELINMVGELIVASASASLLANKANQDELEEANYVVDGLLGSLRRKVVDLRTVSIENTFASFQHIVQDFSVQFGKKVDLVISGEGTKLDSILIDKINESLMHLIGNAIEHGLETPEQRIALGKKPQGEIQLKAYHDSGNLIIEVRDDGAGVNKAALIKKARINKMLAVDQVLADNEINNLIFHPTISTAETSSTNIPRGIGMDLVRRNVSALRGSVELESKEKIGMLIRIRLPIDQSITDAFQVGINGDTYVLPVNMLVECVEYKESELMKPEVETDCHYFDFRGEVLPLIILENYFNYTPTAKDPSERSNIVVVHYAGRKIGLVVDQLIGEFQAVIKPLGQLFEKTKGVSASTLLANGEVSLMLDIPELIQDVVENS